MRLHIYTDGIERENTLVNLEEAFNLLETQSSKELVEDNFIGFTFDNDDQGIIQFIRFTDQLWLIDIPTYENKKYQGALSGEISHHQVFSITRDFFDSNSIFNQGIRNRDYDAIVEYSKTRYGITFNFEVS